MAEAVPPRRKRRLPGHLAKELSSEAEEARRRRRRRRHIAAPEDLARIPLVASSNGQLGVNLDTESNVPSEGHQEDAVWMLSQDRVLSLPVIESSDSDPGRAETTTLRQNEDTVVDLTNDSGVEDEGDVVDLTSPTQIHMPQIVPEHVFLHERPSCRYAHQAALPPSNSPCHPTARQRSTVIQEVISVPESDDEIQVVSSPIQNSHNRRPHTNPPPASLPPSTPPPPSSTKSTLTCPICMDTAQLFESSGRQLVTTVCGHVFCNTCIRNAIQRQHKCPTCRKKLTLKQYHVLFL